MNKIPMAYAGYYIDDNKNRESASGGAASVISEAIIATGGTVYGAVYAEDLYSARYGYADTVEQLKRFKGSKYSFVEKYVIRDGKKRGLYIDVAQSLLSGKDVLFVGLGCDVGNLKNYIKNNCIDDSRLYTVELICNGVTTNNVLEKYVKYKEKEYGSKMISLNLRHKNPDWVPTYISMVFEDGREILERFDYSEFSFAFYGYKAEMCYSCKYKGYNNHQGDLIIGDYWGCSPNMETYNKSGVSIIISKNNKSNRLLERIDKKEYSLIGIHDYQYPIKSQRSLLERKKKDDLYYELDKLFNQYGVIEGIHRNWIKQLPKRLENTNHKHFIVWGAGRYFKDNYYEISRITEITFVCDEDKTKHGKTINGIPIVSPERIREMPDTFVLIAVVQSELRAQIVNKLLDMNQFQFDFFENWVKYSKYIGQESRG